MIPRYDGLVPAIRGPASSSTPTTNTKNTIPTTVARYVMHPASTSTAAAPGNTGRENTSGEHERRLYTFLPSADVSAPPRQLRVASYFFGDTDPSSSAAASGLAAEEESSSSSDEDGDDDGADAEGEQQRQQVRSAPPNASAPASNTHASHGKERRRRRRGREPMRLEYQGIMDVKPVTATSDRVVKMASTPSAVYRHLTCVLMEMPTAWRDTRSDGADGAENGDEAPRATTSSRLVLSTVLARPILQLWGERKEASAAADGMRDGTGAATGISKSWYSEQSTRISKKDWKTMDAAEAEAHKPTNWSDDDGGAEEDGSGSGGAETALAARDRKRAKAEATGRAVRDFLAGTKEALRQQSGVGDTDLLRPMATTAMPPPASSPAVAAASGASIITAKEWAKDENTNQSVGTVRRIVKAAATPSDASAPLTATTAVNPKTPAPVATVSIPSSNITDSNTATSNELESSDASLALPVLAAAVLREVRLTEARETAPLMELQKRILKQLPDFTVMSQKIKAPETKQEAVEWFQTCRQELRVWLQGQGHVIASDGTVTFGG
ncbi:hypothetical protein ABB37_01302 [Leptomonas pyrrhocoris]|uniref:Uncharacterized protein n=1 Tax=Leptomonas pyrrhocoris TaxID=157538 RepID=A0A0N0DZ27_LEPPY|nr:hypothetical protein ABB37_01302 [Leptomonas pyrrhocoris]XP_015663268.1 hypothetical protein ABB37_01302 [Leptomonas pyrrhocoris]KPA84828.1 hypothetical protein ABB37_01302 [Leptomonas pyrrhocoris]KPA84829.1 hypothetical protein ABB37_01302 [Leptomonas pyrrhocoris]|eukprot:XP_015663267.1 hypothetical protein ABB37_01302 [Leptomonas pyrrhocoris]